MAIGDPAFYAIANADVHSGRDLQPLEPFLLDQVAFAYGESHSAEVFSVYIEWTNA
jgi:hypothetical protein